MTSFPSCKRLWLLSSFRENKEKETGQMLQVYKLVRGRKKFLKDEVKL